MARHAHEFQCTNCRWYNYPMLSETMDGNYTIVCGNPACKHHHYRTIKKGVVTEERHSVGEKLCDTIHVMPSASSEKQRPKSKLAEVRELASAGLATEDRNG